ncbi:hypothetical protein DFS34DRAFT_653976 [Phlyctochytrium arcticum]|nr:hypothetical protein DFS34DRAFT_653976 [Phlyctochytrium arcticum]
MSNDEDLATINYFCRRKLYNHLHVYCEERLRRAVNEPLLLFWKAVTQLQQGKYNDGLRALETLQDKRDLALAVTNAMIYAHGHCQMIDHEAVQELDAKFTVASSSPNIGERAFCHLAMFQWHTGFLEDAQATLKKALSINADSVDALALMGWVVMLSVHDTVAAKPNIWLDMALEKRPKSLEALMGRLEHLRRYRQQPTPALDITSQIVVHYPGFFPAHIERTYILMEMNAWKQAIEAAQRLNNLYPNSVDAIVLVCLNELCREGGFAAAAVQIGKLFHRLEMLEPNNACIYFDFAQSFVRLANRSQAVLDACGKLVEKACSLDPRNSAFRAEMGFIRFLQEELPRSKEEYQKSALLDPQNVTALEGIIRCQIFAGQYDVAEEQIELFREFQTERSADLLYSSSLIAWYKYRDLRKRLQCLQEIVEIQLQAISTLPVGQVQLEYHAKMNQDLLLEVVKDYLELCPSEPKREGEDVHSTVRLALDLVEIISKISPGSTDALYCLAKTKFLAGESVAAQAAAEKCLKLDNTYAKAYILMAQIHVQNGRDTHATQILEMGLSYNFQVRNLPLFHILRARIHLLKDENTSALKILEEAKGLAAMKEPVREEKKVPRVKRLDHVPSTHERMTIFLDLVNVDAANTITEASQAFRGLPDQEARLILARAELSLMRNEVDAALNQLATVTADQPYAHDRRCPNPLADVIATSRYFLEAKRLMANIYLDYKHDKKAYARCYSELVDRNPTVESCLLLGDAYMNLQEPEKAIAIYESAMDSSPEATILASKTGKALVRTHSYSRAISYYESALANESNTASALRHDLSKLYVRLKRFEDAERILLEDLSYSRSEDISGMKHNVSCYMLLAQTYGNLQRHDKAVQALEQARNIQSQIVSKEALSDTQTAAAAKLAQIIYETAEMFRNGLKDSVKAQSLYLQAIQHDGTHLKCVLALCDNFIRQHDLSSAQQYCGQLLRQEVVPEEAHLLMSEILHQRNEYLDAIQALKPLVERQPCSYKALAKTIDIHRRNGKLDDISKLITKMEDQSSKSSLHAGFHFCKGLQYRYLNNPNDALREFNFCRRDGEWGQLALYHMIEIFLNPDNETIGGEALESTTDASTGNKKGDSEILAVLTVDKLLKELPQKGSLRTEVLHCHALMATKQKTEIENAIARFAELLNQEREYVPALLGMAIGYMLSKQPPRARNQLKRILKADWTMELADDFEKAWILLADIYIQGGKYDLATDLLRKCLQYNKSCSKASEYLGFIMEKEASYKDASESYELAWSQDRESNPAMGYKLAFNYMKAKKYVEAIDVCHKVLKLYPDYPKLRKEILDKARASLRFPNSS